MKRIKIALRVVLFVPSLLWSLADALAPSPFNAFSFRSVFVQFSGLLAIAMMSAAIRTRSPQLGMTTIAASSSSPKRWGITPVACRRNCMSARR